MIRRSPTALLVASFLVVACSPPAIPPPVVVTPARGSEAPDKDVASPNAANADPLLRPPFGPYDVQTVFFISKSNDHDRVDYGMRLDQHCAPVSDAAIFPYWRELEHAPPVRSHPLSFFQYVGYGMSEQHSLARSPTGGQYRVRLKQFDRPITIVTSPNAVHQCTSAAYTQIQGVPNARLEHIFLTVAGSMSVDSVDVYGSDPKTGAALAERLKG